MPIPMSTAMATITMIIVAMVVIIMVVVMIVVLMMIVVGMLAVLVSVVHRRLFPALTESGSSHCS